MAKYSDISCCGIHFFKPQARPRHIHRGPRPFIEPRLLYEDRRALTADPNTKSDAVDQQLQSRLLTLPRELRNQIWREAIGGRGLDIILHDGRYQQFQRLYPVAIDLSDRRILSLALSCRKVYAETIDTLYRDNRFYFRGPDAILYLRKVFLPQRLNNVQVLHFTWNLPAPHESGSPEEQKWIAVWEELASFIGLKVLKVEIHVPYLWRPLWSAVEVKLLEDARKVESPNDRCLVLGWQQGTENLELPGWKVERAMS